MHLRRELDKVSSPAITLVQEELESPLDFTPQLPFREPTVGKQFAVQNNSRWKQKPTADSQSFPLG